MKLKHLPSGSYLARKTVNKVTYSITYKEKPLQRQVEKDFHDMIYGSDSFSEKGSFKQYADDYIRIKSNVLSPTTIVNYNSILRNLSSAFLTLRFAQITQSDIQREINTYSVGRSPKSVKNASGFISAVMWMYRPNMSIRTKLPQGKKTETYVPSDREVAKILEAIKGSPYEIVIKLCIMGLRKSEAIAITRDDVEQTFDGYMLHIDKAKTVTEDGSYKVRATKTVSSVRTIFIPADLAQLILKSDGYQMFPGNILRYLNHVQDSLGIPHCKLHALRHYYVTKAHALGVPDATIAKAVGHSSIETTQRIYTHAQTDTQIEYEQYVAGKILQ